ncbi:MAG: N-acyl homoserine lactonase family protein [Phenylobacterium sp.]|uniref:N-acyl homoserine lactonase family protein n=1 Tax=Phenylobacterium sp. TaxID=1871053 RepID=UPI001A5FA02E|nr:N-acyl homoserine lactonase family protein [Phenylobacterium sp.]MBL8770573.1 N-acyl homoserine lactonase family protein [Phenylobacterium sp.]
MHEKLRGLSRVFIGAAAATFLAAGAAQAAKAPPKQLELYAIDCGRLPVPDADGFADDGSYKGVSRTMVVPCYLIRHPKGDLVWDTGTPASKDKLLAGLAALDLTPADIEFISISHSHFDHIGNAGLFSASTWIVDPDEKTYAFRPQARTAAAQFAAYSALEASKARLVEGPSLDVFGDRTVVVHQMPGHTPGHTILELKLKGAGTVLLTGDLWHLAESRAGKKVPRFNTDRAQTLKSYEATEALAARTNARVVREHVPEDFDSLPKFPAALK